MDKVLAQIKLMCPTPVLLLPSRFCYSTGLTAFRAHKAITIMHQFIACLLLQKASSGSRTTSQAQGKRVQEGIIESQTDERIMTSELRVETVSYQYCFYTPC